MLFWCTRRVSRRALHRKGHLPFWRLLYSVQAMLSFFWQFEKFGTGEGLLSYGICARCKKQASVVRDAFSGALGAQNRLLWYGRNIRYRKPPPTVRGTSSERRTGKGLFLSGVCCIRCGQCSPFSGSLKNSVPERAFSGTEYARGTKNRLLWYAAHLQKHSVQKTGFCGVLRQISC